MLKTVSALAVAALALAGCSAAPPADDGRVHVVASTSVYGDLVATIGGDHVTVTTLVSGSAVDPHSFEASARDRLSLARADLIVENGGGYDPFIETLVSASGSTAPVISAVEVSGLPDGNEHVWYSLSAVQRVVEAISGELSELDAANATAYRAAGDSLIAAIVEVESRADALGFTGEAAVTELVPVYLLETVGLANATPADFTEAIEEGDDVAPLTLQQTLDLFDRGAVRLLAYNPQTASPATERVRQAAEAAGIPGVEFTETLPEGSDYVSWMTANLDALEAALGR